LCQPLDWAMIAVDHVSHSAARWSDQKYLIGCFHSKQGLAALVLPLVDAPPQNEVVRTSEMKWESPYRFGHIAFALPEMEAINKAAYWDYQRERVYVKSGKKFLRCRVPAPTRHDKPKPNTTIGYQAASHCPTCKSKKIYRHGTRSRTVIDLRFMKYGIKRWVVRYLIHRQRCQSCGSIFNSSDLRRIPGKYGWNLIAYAMYQNIELHLPQLSIDSSMSKLFGLRLPRGWTNKMKMAAAQLYAITHDRLKLSEKPGTSGFDLYAKLEMEQAIAKTLRSNDNPFGFDSCVIHWRI
jgi:predicted Zn-ribbon and HTH transcriptional regulator